MTLHRILAAFSFAFTVLPSPATPQCWTPSAELSQGSGDFGGAVSIHADTLLVGDHYHGEAWIFERDPRSGWSTAALLAPSSVTSGDLFGEAVSLSVDTAVVGDRLADAVVGVSDSEGVVYVFERDLGGPGAWGQAARLVASDGQSGDYFGGAVAISGDVLAVGAWGATVDDFDRAGAVYLFERGATGTWSEVARLASPAPGDDERFGNSLALSGDDLIAGCFRDDADLSDSGSAYIFQRDLGRAWSLVTELTSPAAVAGAEFGWSVALEGDEALVGAWREDIRAGAAYLFERDLGGLNAWGLVKRLAAPDAEQDDRFGASVSLRGGRAIVGASTDSTGTVLADEARGLAFDPGTGTLYGLMLGFGVTNLVTIDVTSSAETLVGPTGFWHMEGLAFDPVGGILYAATNNPDLLVTIDTATGAATPVGPLGSAYVTSLAFDPGAGVLYGVQKGTGSDVLVTISTTSGAATAVGSIGYDRLDGLTFHSVAGKLYTAADSGGACMLIEVDVSTGAGSAVGSSALAWGYPTGMAFDPVSQTTFGAVPDLVTVPPFLATFDVATGAVTPSYYYHAGSAYVFGRDIGGPGAWGLEEKLSQTAAHQGLFGDAVSAWGATAAFGASGHQTVHLRDALPSPAASYCTAGTSASGCRAVVTACGTPSASAASGFWLRASQVEGAKQGLFFFGANGPQAAPWGSGTSYQCVVPPVWRSGLLADNGTPGSCDGAFAQDLNARWCPTCPKPTQNPGAGALVQAQLWYRDPQNTSNQTTSLSDAIEFLVAP